MKNVKEFQLKKCIFLIEDEFRGLADKLNIAIELDYEGASFVEVTEQEKAFAILSDYFGVKEITSIHCDDCELTGVWIVYKD